MRSSVDPTCFPDTAAPVPISLIPAVATGLAALPGVGEQIVAVDAIVVAIDVDGTPLVAGFATLAVAPAVVGVLPVVVVVACVVVAHAVVGVAAVAMPNNENYSRNRWLVFRSCDQTAS